MGEDDKITHLYQIQYAEQDIANRKSIKNYQAGKHQLGYVTPHSLIYLVGKVAVNLQARYGVQLKFGYAKLTFDLFEHLWSVPRIVLIQSGFYIFGTFICL